MHLRFFHTVAFELFDWLSNLTILVHCRRRQQATALLTIIRIRIRIQIAIVTVLLMYAACTTATIRIIIAVQTAAIAAAVLIAMPACHHHFRASRIGHHCQLCCGFMQQRAGCRIRIMHINALAGVYDKSWRRRTRILCIFHGIF